MPRKWIAITTILLLSLVFAMPAWAQEEDETGPELQTDAADPADSTNVDSPESQDGTTINNGFYCRTPDTTHPVVLAISDLYNVPYDEVLGFFCGASASEGEQQQASQRYGLGVIMLAYQTSMDLGDGTTAQDLLDCKSQLGGWGQVWKSLGFKGRSGNGTGVSDGTCTASELAPEGQPGTSVESDQPGNGNGNGNAFGKNKGNKPDKSGSTGKPDHAGPNK